MLDDSQALVDRACGGDLDALRRLLQANGAAVRHKIAGDIGPQWQAVLDADDVMQVTYLEAFLQVPGLRVRTPAGFASWLRRVAENNLRDALKELGRQKRPQPQQRVAGAGGVDSYTVLLEVLGTSSTTPSRVAGKRENTRMIEAALAHLPEDYRTVVKLYDLQERSVEEVAQAMGRSSGAVYMLRARAHDRLRGILGSASQFFSDGP